MERDERQGVREGKEDKGRRKGGVRNQPGCRNIAGTRLKTKSRDPISGFNVWNHFFIIAHICFSKAFGGPLKALEAPYYPAFPYASVFFPACL